MNKSTINAMNSSLTFIIFLLVCINSSHASLMLRITDTPLNGAPTVVTATDQLIGTGTGVAPDNSPGILGLLSASFSTPNFFLTTSMGASKPYPPNSEVMAGLFLRQLAISSINGGSLTIEISDNDFSLDGLGGNGFITGGFLGSLGANPLNSIEIDYYYNTSNTLFDTVGASMISSEKISGGFGFNEGFGRIAVNDVNQPFSVTQVVKVNLQPNYQILSFESGLNVVPEPGILMLIGSGLMMLLAGYRKPFSKNYK